MDRVRACFLAQFGLLLGSAALSVTDGQTVQDSARSPARTESEDKADFETVCGACHTTGMVSDMRSEPEWKETVEHMVSLGAHGSDEQMEAVMRVLLRTL